MKPALLVLPSLLFALAVSAGSDTMKPAKAENTAEESATATEPETAQIITQSSPYSVTETMDRFEAIVKEKGLGVFARIDHRENARQAGLDMNEAQVLIFGNPKAGTIIMQQDVAAALDLPMRVAVYADATGEVKIAYHTPASLATRYELDDNAVLPQLTNALNKLTASALNKP